MNKKHNIFTNFIININHTIFSLLILTFVTKNEKTIKISPLTAEEKNVRLSLRIFYMDEVLDLSNEQIVIEVKNLMNNINFINDKVDIYCDLVKQMFLSGSNKN